MPTSLRKKLFLLVFCLASIAQGMYSTYFVSILITIERIYQIQSKTAGAILSATEIGQILGSLSIAYYGGRGNKPKWMSVCMTFSAIAALISISPHFIQITTNHTELDVNRQVVTLESVNSPSISGPPSSYQSSDLSGEPELHAKPSPFSRVEDISSRNNLCRFENLTDIGIPVKNSNDTLDSILTRAKVDKSEHIQPLPVTLIITIFSICLLVIGFGSTAITTLGIPFIDDIISKEESPLYLGLTIALRIFGPALGFILGSFCISLDLSSVSTKGQILAGQSGSSDVASMNSGWWIGLVVISLLLLILAIPMYFLSRNITINDGEEEDYGNITYQAAEDHDMIDDVDVYTVDQNIIDQWRAPNVCLVVNYLGTSGSTSFGKDELTHNQTFAPSLATRASNASTVSYTDGGKKSRKKQKLTQDKPTISDLSSSLSRLLQNKLLTLRMLSGVLHILPIAGFYTFLPKYLMEQFMVTLSSAGVISGLAGILFVGFGAFIGGTIIRVFNVNSKMMTRWIAASALLYSIGMIILMNFSCDQNQLVHFGSKEIVSSGCSLSCNCVQDTYNPVCYDGATYVTPCLAGCKTRKAVDGRVTYGDCGCSSVTNGTVARPSLVDDSQMNLNIATNGKCSPNCDSIVWYVILFSIFTLIHSSCEVGSMMFNLRCVKPDDRNLALGLITFSSSLLGTIPCSIIYGSIVDSTCVHWDRYTIASDLSGSDNHGACRAYDNESFRYELHGLTAAFMALAFIVDCIISRQSGEVNFYDCDSDESKMDIRVGLKKSTETIQ